MIEIMPLLMFVSVCLLLLAGYPVALTLSGGALLFAGLGAAVGAFNLSLLELLPSRIYGVMNNSTLSAVPLFVFMGVMLQKAKLADSLLEHLSAAFGRTPGGLAIAVLMVGALLAASTGIVGATVVTLGALALPSMLARGYSPRLAAATICSTGTLGQIIPPSIALVLLGDALSSAYHQAQLQSGIFSPKSVSVGSLFFGALIPGLLLVALYMTYIIITCRSPHQAPPPDPSAKPPPLWRTARAIVPAFLLIFAVLGSILAGVATPTEAAGLGAAGAILLGWQHGQLNRQSLNETMYSTLKITSMVFLILIGATVFSLVFRGLGGDEVTQQLFEQLPGGRFTAVLLVMLLIFMLGFILDFIEIIFVVVPIVAPALLMMGIDPIWLGVMIAINLQTSFLTPPFGFALFYLRGVAPPQLETSDLYRGVVPFIALQIATLATLAIWPQIATWLPAMLIK